MPSNIKFENIGGHSKDGYRIIGGADRITDDKGQFIHHRTNDPQASIITSYQVVTLGCKNSKGELEQTDIYGELDGVKLAQSTIEQFRNALTLNWSSKGNSLEDITKAMTPPFYALSPINQLTFSAESSPLDSFCNAPKLKEILNKNNSKNKR